MTTTYLIELRLDQEELILFLEQVPMFKPMITAINDKKHKAPVIAEPTSQLASAEALYKPERGPRAPRAKRGSKVIDTILGSMQNDGPVSVGMLRHALKDAGMAPSSLSTGLAILQKNGTIQRDGNGMYLLSANEGVAA